MDNILKVISMLLLVFSSCIVSGQQNPQYTEYMFNTTNVSSAYVGLKVCTMINVLERIQYVCVDRAPETKALTIDVQSYKLIEL
ncbi:type IX secretion system membrane protein PorP/SprF [Tenacibaculum sp. nBUS_03]|uniref:type IX secretion system membrane protein PorP/SprF n=1 Tax=Tenacibaculum sp. nBUS_03 TaxID=3395320 RepID=UPI003EBA3A37